MRKELPSSFRTPAGAYVPQEVALHAEGLFATSRRAMSLVGKPPRFALFLFDRETSRVLDVYSDDPGPEIVKVARTWVNTRFDDNGTVEPMARFTTTNLFLRRAMTVAERDCFDPFFVALLLLDHTRNGKPAYAGNGPRSVVEQMLAHWDYPTWVGEQLS